ncbi:MAG: hypothetical protein VX642_00245 [Bdellovibrionota bacterium]|nr:hypothetical protein [Bdellovibrionota bacterium]
MIMLYHLKTFFILLFVFQISFNTYAQVATEVPRPKSSQSPWAGPMGQNPMDYQSSESLGNQRDILTRLPELESEGSISKEIDYSEVHMVPGEPKNQISFRVRKYSVKSLQALSLPARKLYRYEHRNSGENEKYINTTRALNFVFIQGTTLVIWAAAPMDWTMKAVAMTLSTFGNTFFIFFQNTLDERIFKSMSAKNLFRLPINAFHKVVKKFKKFEYATTRKLIKSTHSFSGTAGHLLATNLVYWMFFYSYQFLQTPENGFISADIFNKSITSLLAYIGTAFFLTASRANFKEFGRGLMTERVAQNLALFTTVTEGAVFILLAQEGISKASLVAIFGLPSVALYAMSFPKPLKASVSFVRKITSRRCKSSSI